MIWLQIAVWWLVATYTFMGVWVALKRPAWETGIQFHSRRVPLPPTHRAHIFLATLAQFGLIVLLWPFYSRARMPFYRGEADPPEELQDDGPGSNPEIPP